MLPYWSYNYSYFGEDFYSFLVGGGVYLTPILEKYLLLFELILLYCWSYDYSKNGVKILEENITPRKQLSCTIIFYSTFWVKSTP